MSHRSWSARHLRGLRACLVAGVLFAIPCGVLVRNAAAGDADKAAARAHYETATRLYDVREYAEALKEFKTAYLSKPDPAFLFNIGQCNFKMGKNQEALDFFQQFLKKAPADDPNRGLVETRIRNIQAGRGADSESPEGPGARPVAPPAGPPEVTPSPPPLAVVPMEVSPPPGLDVSVKTTTQEQQAVPSETPLYRTWWFWTGVGAVVIGGALATYFLLPRGGGTSVPDSTLGTRRLP